MVASARTAVVVALLLWSGLAGAAEFTASVDRKELYVNEHVLLTLSLTDSDTRLRAEGVSPNVDLTLLAEQFELGVPRADFRFNINRNRGRSTSTIRVELFPRHSGRLSIPSFEVDGLTTESIELRVLELPDEVREEVFGRSGVHDPRLLVREQTLVYLDLYHRVDLDSARLGGPIEIHPSQVELHELPRENRTEQIDGIEYRVTRTAWAISPLSSEPITIYLPDIWIETLDGRRWRLPVREERLEVEPLPAEVPADALVGQPVITTSGPGDATAGQMTPWEITLRAATALNALPAKLPFGQRVPELRIFMDPPERRLEFRPDGGIESVAVYRGSIMPLEPGAFTLPSITLPWYDPGQQQLARLSVPGSTLQVRGSADGSPAAVGSQSPDATATAGAGTELALWQAAAGLLLLAWLATLALWQLHSRPSANGRNAFGRSRKLAPPSGAASKERLLAAFGSRTLEQGLRSRERRFGIDAELRAVVRDVQRYCYHPASGSTEAAELRQRVERVVARIQKGGEENPNTEQDSWSPRAFRPAGDRQ